MPPTNSIFSGASRMWRRDSSRVQRAPFAANVQSFLSHEWASGVSAYGGSGTDGYGRLSKSFSFGLNVALPPQTLAPGGDEMVGVVDRRQLVQPQERQLLQSVLA